MAWVQLTKFQLYPCDMCVGQPDFQPHIPASLKYGLEKGKYKIQYISGAVRSNNKQRYQRDNIVSYERKWNKYYDISDIPAEVLSTYNYSFFPQLKLNVFQCQYGTLPGFTKAGTASKQLAEYYATNNNIIEQTYQIISSQIKPLQFEITDTSNISFWYTDNCAPCVQGNIMYVIYQNIENTILPVNSIGVLSFDIYTLKPNIPEYYQMQVNDSNALHNIPYVYQQNLLEENSRKQYILNLKKYNAIGYDLNKNNIYLSYKNSYKSQIIENVFWKIKKIRQYNLFNLISQISTITNIPLFAGIYTIIPSNTIYFEENEIILKYNNMNIPVQQLMSQFTFSLQQTTLVTFMQPCYLYSGKITLTELFKDKNIDIKIEEQQSVSINTIKQDINFVNSNFYLYITQEYIQILTVAMTSVQINNSLYGPFDTIQQSKEQLIKYCINNSLDYQQITETKYVIGNKNV